jgi:hypothetical protein
MNFIQKMLKWVKTVKRILSHPHLTSINLCTSLWMKSCRFWSYEPAILLLALSNLQIFFELLIHGGDAEEVIKWWQKHPDDWFQKNAFVDGVRNRYAFCADKLCSTLTLLSHFLTRQKFPRQLVEKFWREFHVQGRIQPVGSPERWTALLEQLEAPQSLKQLSRLAVRQCIRAQNLARYVPSLPLPDGMKEYLMFSAERPAEDKRLNFDDVPGYDLDDGYGLRTS